jgi:hypothetical protein
MLLIECENAVTYHEPVDVPPLELLQRHRNRESVSLPSPIPTENTVPESARDLIFLRVKDITTGKIIIDMTVQNSVLAMLHDYSEGAGTADIIQLRFPPERKLSFTNSNQLESDRVSGS